MGKENTVTLMCTAPDVCSAKHLMWSVSIFLLLTGARVLRNVFEYQHILKQEHYCDAMVEVAPCSRKVGLLASSPASSMKVLQLPHAERRNLCRM